MNEDSLGYVKGNAHSYWRWKQWQSGNKDPRAETDFNELHTEFTE